MKQNLYDDPQFFNMYKTLRDSKITYNDFIEQPAMRRLLPEVEGLTIADLGCGFGDLALYLVENGAQQVVGVDLSENMLQHAKNMSEFNTYEAQWKISNLSIINLISLSAH